MEEGRMLDIEIADYQKCIGENIRNLSEKRKIKQSEMVEKCKNAGYTISQATISNAKQGKGNLTISNLIAISYALDVNVLELLDTEFVCKPQNEENKMYSPNANSEMFIRNPNSAFLKSYLGKYHVLFFKTSGNEGNMIEGTLQLEPNNDETKCIATMLLQVDEIDAATGKAAEKIYKGEFIVSQAMRANYCYLINERLGEMCMLIFQHIYTSFRQVETAMAVAVTTASGSNRRPTAHRMCISRSKVKADTIEYVKGQLCMNTSDIYLTKEQVETIYRNNSIPETFKKILINAARKGECYRVPESSLYDSTLSESDLLKFVSLVRAQSDTPKYNKISRKTDEALYALLKDKK